MSLAPIGSSNYIKPAYSIETNPLFQYSPLTGGVLNTDDSINIGAFDANAQPNASSQKLQDLYQKKADAQQAVNDSKNEHSDKQSAINDRKAELISSRQSDNKTDDSQKQYAEAKQQYDQKNSEKNSAANELNQIQQQSSAKDQEISANAQQTQQVTADLNAARSELASLTPPTPPSGEDKDAQANYESQKAAYEERKAAIQAKIDAKTAEQQQLQAKAQQLQSAKDQLARQQQTKEHAVAQLDGELQKLQAEMDKCEQKMSADDPELKKTIEEDQQLQTLQDEEQQAQQEIDTKQSELDAIQTEIDQAEAEDSTLQAARSETAHSQLETTAKAAGYDVEASAAAAQETAAREAYGKSYDQLSDEEKISIESKVDGEVTLELMDKARKVLETDPDNSAAQSILEKGGKDLEARQNWAQSNIDNAISKLPEDLQNRVETAKGIAEGKTDAEGSELDFERMQEIVGDLAGQLVSGAYSPEETAALRETLDAAKAYASAIEQKFAGEAMDGVSKSLQSETAETADKDAILPRRPHQGNPSAAFQDINYRQNYNNMIDSLRHKGNISDTSQLANEAAATRGLNEMRTQMAEDLGVSEEDITVLSAGDGSNDIKISSRSGGGINVTIDGEVHSYTEEEAKYLLIDGGKGGDQINVNKEVTQELHIYGGLGSDTIQGGSGSDTIDGGWGDDRICGGSGNDNIKGSDGSDYINGEDGNDNIIGGWNMDTIIGGSGRDTIDGKWGRDTIYDDGTDQIQNGLIVGDDVINDPVSWQALSVCNETLESLDSALTEKGGSKPDPEDILSGSGEASGDLSDVLEILDQEGLLPEALNHDGLVPDTLGIFGDTVQIREGIQEIKESDGDVKQIIEGACDITIGACSLAGDTKAGPVADILDGAISHIEGKTEIYEGIQEGDKKKILHGFLTQVSGDTAIAAAFIPELKIAPIILDIAAWEVNALWLE